MGWGKFMNFVNRGYVPLTSAEGSEVEMVIEDIIENLTPVPFAEFMPRMLRSSERMTGTSRGLALMNESDQYTKLKEWIRSEHVDPKFNSSYASTEDDGRNPENILVSYKVVHSVSMTYRDSLKPLFNAVCNKITETDECIINDVLPEFEKRPQYQEFGIYSTENPTGYYEGLSYTFEQNPISGELSIDVKIHDSIHQNDYESSYILKVDDGKIVEFKNYEESPAYDYISNAVLDGKTLTLESTVSDEHWTFGMLIGCTEPFKCFTYQGIEEVVYKSQLDKIDDRVKALEQKHSLGVSSDFESRLAALELKCRNIELADESVALSVTPTLTLEQRLEILERKLNNII